jgi:20S proteasome subunit beta 1
VCVCVCVCLPGLSHAMARDGSSGGVVRMAVIEEAGIERLFVPGNELPWQDHQGV